MTNDAPIRGLANRTCPRLPALLLGVLLAGAGSLGWAQVPDNRGVRLDPEDPVPPAYRDTLEARDRQRLDAAREQGTSFLPTFQGRGRAPEGEATAPETAGAAPVLPEPMLRPPRAAPPPPVSAYETFGRERPRGGGPDDGLAELLHVLLETWSRAPEVVRLRYPEAEASAGEAPSPGTPARAGSKPPVPRLPPVEAGTGLYARTVYAVDSGLPGPVVLEVLEPPLAGARATGGFERVGERMVLRLDRLGHRGASVPVDAWAVGPDCACFGVAGEVDRHLLERVVLPAAVRFAEGFLAAAGEPERTLVLHGGDVLHERGRNTARRQLFAGLGAAARSVGDVLLEDAPRQATVRIPRDTELLVMFAAPLGTPPPGALPGVTVHGRERTDAGQ